MESFGLRLEFNMSIFYSPQLRGFYNTAVHGDAIPADAIEINNEQRIEIRRELGLGKLVTYEGGAFVFTTSTTPIETIRARTSIPKGEFCMGLSALGILSDADALSASRNNWPAAMDGFLDFLTPAQALEVQIEWATCQNVERMHPFVLTLASWASLSDETVDTLFGITTP